MNLLCLVVAIIRVHFHFKIWRAPWKIKIGGRHNYCRVNLRNGEASDFCIHLSTTGQTSNNMFLHGVFGRLSLIETFAFVYLHEIKHVLQYMDEDIECVAAVDDGSYLIDWRGTLYFMDETSPDVDWPWERDADAFAVEHLGYIKVGKRCGLRSYCSAL